jgi:aminopeptidase-like protein
MANIYQEQHSAIMTSAGPKEAAKSEDLGKEIYNFMVELYPICRSITGEGVRETLRAIRKRIPLEMHEVPKGNE